MVIGHNRKLNSHSKRYRRSADRNSDAAFGAADSTGKVRRLHDEHVTGKLVEHSLGRIANENALQS